MLRFPLTLPVAAPYRAGMKSRIASRTVQCLAGAIVIAACTSGYFIATGLRYGRNFRESRSTAVQIAQFYLAMPEESRKRLLFESNHSPVFINGHRMECPYSGGYFEWDLPKGGVLDHNAYYVARSSIAARNGKRIYAGVDIANNYPSFTLATD